MRTQQKTVMHKPARGISPETNPASTLGLGLEAQNLEKINLLFNHPICGILLWETELTQTIKWLCNITHWCCSVAKSCTILSDHMDCSMSDLPLFHYLLEFAQAYVHWINGTIQPSHPLPPSSPFVFNLSQHQGIFHIFWHFYY